ncbi:hypothetical protein [Bacillus amyloliquefaciens]|uniref:hypothetical protein n=1 Tax=Bacillus amyloliquefaciens TaxID=1390 RepID=UPI002FF662D9
MVIKEDLIMPNGISKLLSDEMLSDIKKIAFNKNNKGESIELRIKSVDNFVDLTLDGKVKGLYTANHELKQLLIENECILLYILRMNFYTGLTMKVIPKGWGICESMTTYFIFPKYEELSTRMKRYA